MALVLVALSAGMLATIAAASTRALVGARRDATATALAGSALDGLRAGPRAAGGDTIVADGVSYVRRWTATAGHGRPDRLDVAVAWPEHGFALGTEALR